MRIGISLSGGGARGIAHIGVLQALVENNIHPEILAGTSAGSIVGTLYAAGHSPQVILDFVKTSSYFKVLRPGLGGGGFTSLEYLREHLADYISVDSFEALHKPMHICTANLNLGELVVFSEGPLFDKVMASCAVPLVFKPIAIDDNLYCDGGLFDNMPVSPLRDACDFLIGVNVMPRIELPTKKVNSMLGIASRVFDLAIWNTMRANFNICDIVLEPQAVYDFNPFNFLRAQELYDVGYEHGIQQINMIKSKMLLEVA